MIRRAVLSLQITPVPFSKTCQKKARIPYLRAPVTYLIGNYATRAHKHNNEEQETILCLQIKISVRL